MKKVIFLLFITIFSFSCKESISNKIQQQLKSNFSTNNIDSCIVNFDEFIDFKWDEMFVFQSWSMPEDISSAIGFKYNGQYVADDTRRIIFIHKNNIVHEEDYPVSMEKFSFDFIDFVDSSFCQYHSLKFMAKRIKILNTKDKLNFYYLYPIQ